MKLEDIEINRNYCYYPVKNNASDPSRLQIVVVEKRPNKPKVLKIRLLHLTANETRYIGLKGLKRITEDNDLFNSELQHEISKLTI